MSEDTIVCPNCGTHITLSDALRSSIEDGIRTEFESRLAEEVARSRERMEKDLTQERSRFEAELNDKRKDLEGSQRRELELLRKNRELEESKKTLELEVERRVHEEGARIEETVEQRLSEQHRLRDIEKDKQLSDLRKQIEDLKRKAEQGSEQLRGEVAELDLEAFLRATFPQDEIEPVPKGVRGADLIQRVIGPAGRGCGAIAWEVKNTRTWSDVWLEKLREDQRELKADLAAILTTALPSETRHLALIDRVWVTDSAALPGLAVALRTQLVQVALARAAAEGRDTKMDLLYDYLTGTEFRQRVEAVVETFVALKEDLERERRAVESSWAKRDKQISRAISALAGMYGAMQGIVGTSLPRVTYLELGPPDAETVSGTRNGAL